MLSEKQKKFFHKEGYLVVPDVVSQDKYLEPIRSEYSDLLDDLIKCWVQQGKMIKPLPSSSFFEKLLSSYVANCDWFQPMDISLPGGKIDQDTPMHFSEATFKLLTCKEILDIVEQLIGAEVTSVPIQHVRLKPPLVTLRPDEIRAHISSTDWHQDRGVVLPDADATTMVTVWIAVTDANRENGCLKVVPKKQVDNQLLPHCPKKQTAIADNFLHNLNSKSLPIKSGGVIILHPLTPHGSFDNLTDQFRWSFDIRYSRTGEPTGRSHFPSFVARSRLNPDGVLRDWREWKKMWEETRAELASKQQIPIHRWESNSPFCA